MSGQRVGNDLVGVGTGEVVGGITEVVSGSDSEMELEKESVRDPSLSDTD